MRQKSVVFINIFFAAFFGQISLAGISGRPPSFYCATVFSPQNAPGFTAKNAVYLSPDILDWHRDFGMKFFLDSDPIWKDPEYLKEFRELATPQRLTTYYGTPAKLLYDFKNLMSELGNGKVLVLASTGTQANNLMISAAKKRYSRKFPNSHEPKIIYFENPYGGSFGEVLHMKHDAKFVVGGASVSPNAARSIFEEAILTANELAAIQRIERLFESEPIAGIFIEPFAINNQAGIYRPFFLSELRKLADRLQTPILADEILSGGGRTGNFWSYEYAQGFYPDLVTFGKGLIAAGVFQPTAQASKYIYPNYFYEGPSETLSAHPVALLQSIQVLKAIRDRKLMDQVQATSRHMLQRLVELQEHNFLRAPNARVFGSIYHGNIIVGRPPSNLDVRSSYGRYNTPLTLTPDQVDAILGFKPFIFENESEAKQGSE